MEDKEEKRRKRHKRIRKKIFGTPERPRLVIHKSHKNFMAQAIDDLNGRVLLGFSTLNKEFRTHLNSGGNVKAAKLLGEIFAEKAKERGIIKVVFDRGGYPYHGRIKAFAEALRKGGLEF